MIGRRRRGAERSDPLLYFVHVPKTAGSMINSQLRFWSENGFDHAEAFWDDQALWPRRLREARWMSGHTHLQALTDRLSDCPRPVRMFSCVREPTAQVMSHVNWLIEIHERGDAFYDGHPERAKEISAFVRSLGPRTPADVIEVLRRYPGLFANQQSRVALGDGRSWPRAEMPSRIAVYELIGADPGTVYRAMTGEPLTVAASVNASRYHFDRALFSSPEVTEFLSRYNAQDYDMFDVVTAGAPAG